MLITTRAEYGIRAMIRLALAHDDGRPLPVKTIAGKEGISRIYLEQLFNRLKKQGIVESVRGPRGGYLLADHPDRINALDVIEVLDGKVKVRGCAAPENGRRCRNFEICAAKEIWDRLEADIRSALRGYSLGELARISLKKQPEIRASLYD